MKHLPKIMTWTALGIGVVASILFSFYYFTRAFPLLTINVTINRAQALEKAQTIATRYALGPKHAQHAVEFYSDNLVKTFAELEAGGIPALTTMMEHHWYIPYGWSIRFVKEFDHHELQIHLTPEGKQYGFTETISENKPGAALTQEAAHHIARTFAIDEWHLDLTPFAFVEHAQKIQPSGRIDHFFIYERIDTQLGTGTYRVRLAVSGNKCTELMHYVKVPEEFILRYQEMRSANNTLAWVANILMQLLYIIGGCVIGLYFLMRRQYLIWKQPAYWALGLATLDCLSTINQWPLMLFYYDSAVPFTGFFLTYCLRIFYNFLYTFGSLFLICMAAESVTRLAFGNHIQLWRIWSSASTATRATQQQTLLGYGLALFDVAFGIAFYMVTRSYFSWWVPADTLINPNILATYLPALPSIADSLMAGFKEECLFRAIPLGFAVILGNRFGKKNWWIAAAFVIQVFIFGAAHANYATQPAYARIIEIIVPAALWGILYLRYGLFPAILCHVLVDLIWMSLPIFVAEGTFAYLNQACILAWGAIPLLIIIYVRFKNKKSVPTPASLLNKAWRPTTTAVYKRIIVIPNTYTFPTSSLMHAGLLGCLGLILWITTTKFYHYAPTMQTTRKEAQEKAHTRLRQQSNIDPAQWTTLVAFHPTYSDDESAHTFIWQENRLLYRSLLENNYILPPYWLVRLIKFHGTIIDRSEEYQVLVGPAGIIRTAHRIPESTPGAQLSAEEARAYAHRFLQELNVTPDTLTEISAIAQQQPARKDWQFIFSNPMQYPLSQGQARSTIEINGNQLASAVNSIYVPEQWQRNERKKLLLNTALSGICRLLLYLLLCLGIVLGLRTSRALPWRIFLLIYGVLSLFSVIVILNNLPDIIASFNTSEPYGNQLFTTVTALLLRSFPRNALYALILSILYRYTPRYTIAPQLLYPLGICAGLFIAGSESLVTYLQPVLTPFWADYTPICTVIPALGIITSYVRSFLIFGCWYALLVIILDYLQTKNFSALVQYLTCVLSILTISGYQTIQHAGHWAVSGCIIGAVVYAMYHTFLKFDPALIWPLLTTLLIVNGIQEIVLYPFPAIVLGTILAMALLMFITYLLVTTLQKRY